LPTNSVNLSGSGTDPDGTIASYSWTKISGPASGKISSTGSAGTKVTSLVAGVYKFQLKVTDDDEATDVDTVAITVNDKLVLLPAVHPAHTVNGLDYKYYEASMYKVLPDFTAATPRKKGTTTNFNLSLASRDELFAFSFTGFIQVPADGEYTFYTNSDDGSKLYIDNVLVVNNDREHYDTEKSGTIGLKAGKHSIAVGYFNQFGGKLLEVSYSGPGVIRQTIAGSVLYRISSDDLSMDNNSNQTIMSSAQVGIKAYPNPFADHIELSITGGLEGGYQLVLVDVSGKTLWIKNGVKNSGNFQQSINTAALQRGVYFLKVVQNNATTSVIKLVK
jgi:hypothetical protein